MMKAKWVILLTTVLGQSAVFAEGAADQQMAGSPMGSLVMFGLIIFMMYFLMIRPQNKKAKEHRNLLTRLEKGDEVVTNSGILGKISKVTDQFFLIAIADGIEITMQKQAVAGSLPKGTLKSV